MGQVVKLRGKDESFVVKVRMPRALKLALEAHARQNGRRLSIEAQARLARSLRDEVLNVHLREVNKLLGVHLDGIRDTLLAQSHVVSALSQETMVTRQRLEEAMRLIAAAFSSELEEPVARASRRRR